MSAPTNEDRVVLTPELLLRAYELGIFPMAESADSPSLHWLDPPMRGVLPLNGFHIPKSLIKRMRKGGFTVTHDCAFAQVMEGCANRDETWINEAIHALYNELFERGKCHSVEVWMDGELAGGLYGVCLKGAFFGESMFSRRTDASKIALVYLVARLKLGGFSLLDAQFVTDHLRRFGAVEIPRAQYRDQLEQAQREKADFGQMEPDASLEHVLFWARRRV